MPRSTYRHMLQREKLQEDPAQARVVDALQDLFDALVSHAPKRSRFFSFFKQAQPIKGLYIYGGVGRGKSMLMDVFYDQLPAGLPARRIHFHEFMGETHEALHTLRRDHSDDIIPQYAKQVAERYRILCFDEFHVSDIADAMILGRLFENLFNEGVVVVTTSNRHPDDLYKGGLQRDRFLPFIDLLKRHMKVMHLDSETDYRIREDEDDLTTHYMTPLGDRAHQWANRVFIHLTGGKPTHVETLTARGRSFQIECVQNIARVTFSELCERPYSAGDYLIIAEHFSTLVLEGVPKMGYDRRNEAKRFMTLIDVLYDRGINLYMTAAVQPDKLYRGKDHEFEFDRTISRLNQMMQAR